MSAAEKQVTMDRIDSTKGVMNLRELAGQFDPPVSFEKCKTANEMKHRLRCALKKQQGNGKDLNAFSELINHLQVEDHTKRHLLYGIFEKTECFIQGLINAGDDIIIDQLEQQTNTKECIEKLNAFKAKLQVQECPIVVAGQVSAGKSTFLNLLLGHDTLPHRLLSCTATICELGYSETNTAYVLHKNGEKIKILFEEKDDYIFKKDERERQFEHKGVRINMNVPFLKSGVLLVDTPGIGENEPTNNFLVDYVTENDVLSFIFVIKCDDSGGLLQRFILMLRQLASVRNDDGHYKLDPKSLIFVANFWDKIPRGEEEVVRNLIRETLKHEPCLRGFDVDQQLFYMNSQFAWNTWTTGLISEDYEKLIDGVESFLPCGLERRLKIYYTWLETFIIRILHPLRTLLNKVEHSTHTVCAATSINQNHLSTIKKQSIDAHDKIKSVLDRYRKELTDKTTQFLQSDEMFKSLTKWSLDQIPVPDKVDEWILFEDCLDEAIGQRISSLLQDWEIREGNFEMAEHDVLTMIQEKYRPLLHQLKNFERTLRNISEPCANGDDDEVNAEVPETQSKHKSFNLEEFRGYSRSFSVGDLFSSLFLSPVAIFKMTKRSRNKEDRTRQKNAEMFKKNKIQYMTETSEQALKDLKTSVKHIEDLVDSQLLLASENIKETHAETLELIGSNESLMEKILGDRRGKDQVKKKYGPATDIVISLLDELITFRHSHLSYKCDVKSDELQPVQQKIPTLTRAKLQPSLIGISYVYKMKDNVITVTTLDASSAFKINHIYFMDKNLRDLRKNKGALNFIPESIGVTFLKSSPSICFNGDLMSARCHLLSTKSHRRTFVHTFLVQFMTAVGEAVEFLHLTKLVHIELSLDSVLVNKDGIPKLCNITEKIEMPFPYDLENSNVGNYVYIAPETFPTGPAEPYSHAADVYALALMLLELWSQSDIYRSHKDRPLVDFLRESDPGQVLQDCASDLKLLNYPTFISKCLLFNPKERIPVHEYNDEQKRFFAELSED